MPGAGRIWLTEIKTINLGLYLLFLDNEVNTFVRNWNIYNLYMLDVEGNDGNVYFFPLTDTCTNS